MPSSRRRSRALRASVRAGSPLVNVQLKDAQIRPKFGVTIIAIVKSREESIQDHPRPDTTIDAGDILILDVETGAVVKWAFRKEGQ